MYFFRLFPPFQYFFLDKNENDKKCKKKIDKNSIRCSLLFSMKAQTYRNVIDARTPADKISSHFNLQPRAYDTQNRKEKWTERMNNENKNKL